jgi:hypothetical protein
MHCATVLALHLISSRKICDVFLGQLLVILILVCCHCGDYVALKGKAADELGKIRKEAVMAKSWNSLWRTEYN